MRPVGCLLSLAVLALGANAFAAKQPACAKLAKQLRSLEARIEKQQAAYFKKLRCSVAAWENYRSQRRSLGKLRGMAGRIARRAIADLDRRNARLRKIFKRCEAHRQGLEKLFGAFNAQARGQAAQLQACRLRVKTVPAKVRAALAEAFRPL